MLKRCSITDNSLWARRVCKNMNLNKLMSAALTICCSLWLVAASQSVFIHVCLLPVDDRRDAPNITQRNLFLIRVAGADKHVLHMCSYLAFCFYPRWPTVWEVQVQPVLNL